MTDGFLLSLCLSLFSTLSNSLALLLCRSLLCRVHKRPTMDSLSLFRTRAFSHPLSFARSLALSLSLFHFRAISLSRSLSCRVHKRPTTDSHSLALSLSRSLFRSLALPLSRSLALPFSRSLTLSLSCCLLSRSLALSLSRSLALLLSCFLALLLFPSSCLHKQDGTGGTCRLVLASEQVKGPKRPVARRMQTHTRYSFLSKS